jgi:hypothetical protein
VRRACSLLAVLLAAQFAGAAPATIEAPVALHFGELYRQPIGPRGLEPSARLQLLIGRRVQVVGYRVLQEQSLPDAFILAPYALTTAERSDGLADDLPPTIIYVHALPEQIAAARAGATLVRVEGVLEWGALEEADGRVSWLRIRAGARPREIVGVTP